MHPLPEPSRMGKAASEFYQGAETFASGLRVPKPYGDVIILDILRRSGGRAVSSDDATILGSILDWARQEGLFLSPEGAAATAAYDALLASEEIKPEDRVVLFNTGAGLKYTDTVARAMHLRRHGSLPDIAAGGGNHHPRLRQSGARSGYLFPQIRVLEGWVKRLSG